MDRDALQQLSKDELITLMLAQAGALARFAEQVATLTERISVLEVNLGLPPKTPDNSSVPPICPPPATPSASPSGASCRLRSA